LNEGYLILGILFGFRDDGFAVCANQFRTADDIVLGVGPLCKFGENLIRLVILVFLVIIVFLLIPEYNILCHLLDCKNNGLREVILVFLVIIVFLLIPEYNILCHLLDFKNNGLREEKELINSFILSNGKPFTANLDIGIKLFSFFFTGQRKVLSLLFHFLW